MRLLVLLMPETLGVSTGDAFRGRRGISLCNNQSSLPSIIRMLAKDCLPLIDLTRTQTSSTISSAQAALRQFGAFRVVAPQLTRGLSQSVFQNVRALLSIQPALTCF